MKGYSFKSLTNLVLKILGTKVNAGTGLSGGGSLEADRTLSVKYGTTAGTATQGNDSRVVNAASNATVDAKEAALEAKKADKATTITAGTGLTGGGSLAANRTLNVSYGTAAGTAAQGNDSRLSNSREWTGSTISQAEAEAGTATTRRAFTAQRVRQAIVAWFNGISGALGRTILTRTTAAQVRSDIGLGTAATRNVGTASGNVMEVGAGGWLGLTERRKTKLGNYNHIFASDGSPEAGHSAPWSTTLTLKYDNSGIDTTFISQDITNGQLTLGGIRSGSVLPNRIVIDSQSLSQGVGQSTLYPMSQKATTDQLATKANTTTQVIAGTGLTGGGTLAANRTLNVSYGTAAGTAAQGNDSRLSNSREWTAGTVSQAEAEAGTATTRRAWTAQRVWQAIDKWASGRQVISGTGLSGGGTLAANRTLSVNYGTAAGTAVQGNDSRVVNALQRGNNLSDTTNKTLARSNLGLGTAATKNVGTSAGQVMEVGAFGLGANISYNPDITLEAQHIEGLGTASHGSKAPSDSPNGVIGKVLYIGGSGWGSQMWFSYNEGRVWFRNKETGKQYESWKEFYHTGNMPATATRWPAFTEVTGRPANYPTTWASVAAKPAQATRWPSFTEVTSKPATATRWPTWDEVGGKPPVIYSTGARYDGYIGYQSFSSGLIVQWIVVTTNSNGDGTVNFPTAFPNDVMHLSFTHSGTHPVAFVLTGNGPRRGSATFSCKATSNNLGGVWEVKVLAVGW